MALGTQFPRIGRADRWRLALAAGIALGLFAGGAVGQSALGNGTLLVAGTTLVIAPESQTVPFDTPTIVHTTLQGFDPGSGALPADLRVVGDFTGPEIDGVLELATVPNEPFRIPRLSLRGGSSPPFLVH